MNRIAITKTLTPGFLRHLEETGAFDAVAYHASSETDIAPASASKLKIIPCSFKDARSAFLDHWRMTFDLTERLFDDTRLRAACAPYAASLALPGEHALNALKKAVGFALSEDCKTICLTDSLVEGEARTFFVQEPELLRLARPDKGAYLPSGSAWERAFDWLKFLGYAAYLAARVLEPVFRREPRPRRIAFIFEQYYSSLNDQEFTAIYRYFKSRDDVQYACTDYDEKYSFLAGERKHPVVFRWGVRGMRKKAAVIGRLARLVACALLDRTTPFAIKMAALKLFKHALKYDSLFERYKPRFHLGVRADMLIHHPVITGMAEIHGARHIGYTCGSYSCFVFFYALIDFHYYGLLGRHLKKDLYGDVWPKNIRYPVIGPFTVELTDEPAPQKIPPVLGVFPTTSLDEFFMGHDFYREFLECARDAALSAGTTMIYKEKYIDDQRLGWVHDLYDGKVDYQIVSVSDRDDIQTVTTPEVIDSCSLALIMGASTSGWEAMSRKRKVLFYEQPWITHPIEKYEPRLVVKNRADFMKTFLWLWNLPQNEYEALLEPVLENCGKASNGKLVQDFLEAIERESPLPRELTASTVD